MLRWLFPGFVAKEVYAFLNAWWLCLYVAPILSMDVLASLIGGSIVAIIDFIMALTDMDILHRGFSDVPLFLLCCTGIMGVAVVSSPAIVNFIIWKIVDKYKRSARRVS